MSDNLWSYQRIEVTTFGDREPQYIGGIEDERGHEWRCAWCASANAEADHHCTQCGAPHDDRHAE